MIVQVLGWAAIAFGGYTMVAQAVGIWHANKHGTGYSVAPLMSGVLLSCGLFMVFGWNWYCAVPLIIDPGGVVFFAVAYTIAWVKKQPPFERK